MKKPLPPPPAACRPPLTTDRGPLIIRPTTLLLSLLLLTLCTGCHLGRPGSASFASVTISGKTTEQICAAAAAVFRADGYLASASGQGLIFEKEATRGSTLARDGLLATQAGARSIERVRAQVVDLGGGSCRLQCQAYMVSGAGDSFFEEEHPLATIRSGPYQSLLNKVASSLK